MRKYLSIAAIGFFTAPAWATLIFYDGFDYTAGDASSGPYLAPRNDTTGSPNPGQHNVAYNVDWRYAGGGATGQNAPFISGNNLSFAGFPASTGNGVGFDTTQLGSSRIQISPTALNSGTIYWSALLRVDALATTGANGMLLGGFNNTPGAGGLPTAVGACLRIKTDPTDSSKFLLGTATNSGTGAGNVQFESSGHSLGDTVLIVGAYTFVSGSNNDMAQMWINPTPGGAQPAATLTSNPGLADPFASLSTFNIRNVNTVGTGTTFFDELRVGDDWGSVTPIPEPATLGLLLAGAMPLALRRRNRRLP